MAQFDLLIRGGSVIDGTGAPARTADLGVRDGRIVALGEVTGDADREIDAMGWSVAPGFIDVHCHDDIALLNTPSLDFKTAQGVTTVVCGNCGLGAAPANEHVKEFFARGIEGVLGPVENFSWSTIGEFYDAVRGAKPVPNAAFLVPHGTLRVSTMGWEHRDPTEAELGKMKEHLAEGMAAGAVGLSTGLMYVPGAFAKTEELIELNRVVAEYGGLYVSHIRNEGNGLLDSVREAIRIGEEAGTPVQISHHKASGRDNWGLTKESLPLIDAARERGVRVTMDAYPYTAASTSLAALTRNGRLVRALDPHDVMVASVKYQHEYEGKRLDEIADIMDLPVEDAVPKLLNDEDQAVVAVMFIMDEADVQRVLQHPQCMIGSDGIPSPTGKPHPRLYGTFPRVLERYVRNEKLFSLEEGVRKMTQLPAKTFMLADRGELREGAWADIVIFDASTITEKSTYDEPRQYPSGISHVIVNGQVVVEDGKVSQTPSGQFLTRP
ncbi:MAG: D-aminoacylase [Chloroflexi bacterium]|nr:D-aminoacylase [Chloroflexota bacterium]